MRKLIVILVVTLALVMCLFAAGSDVGDISPQMSIIPADAVWVLNFDMEKFTSSVLFKMLLDEEGFDKLQRRSDQFIRKLKIDPMKDIRGIAVFGRGKEDKDAVVAVSGNFDKTHLLGLIKTETERREIPYGKHLIYNWGSDEFGTFATDNLALLSESAASLKLSLDTLDGKVPNVLKSPQFSRLLNETRSAIIVAATSDLSSLAGERGGPVMLAKMRTASGSLTEVGDMVSVKADIGTESAQVAKEIEQAIRGLIAIVNLQVKDADALALTQNINIAVDGEQVRIDAVYPMAKLVELLKKHRGLPHLSLDKLGPLSYH
jgi:hypothetical protein